MIVLLTTIHLIVLSATAVVILFADHEGFQYIRGEKETLDPKTVQTFHRLVWAGLVIMIATGGSLLSLEWTYRLLEPIFFLKLAFVGILVFNAIAIGNLARIPTERAFRDLSKKEKQTLVLSGALSWIGWVGAAVVGLFFL